MRRKGVAILLSLLCCRAHAMPLLRKKSKDTAWSPKKHKMVHTILLIQPTVRPDSRTWSDYETTTDCLEGICKIYEEFLKKQNPSMASITYDVSHLYEFIDKLSDLSCLILNPDTCQYTPHNKDWIKEKIFIMLRTQARND